VTATGLPAAPGYNPRRTLPLRVEALRQLRRRRTMVAALILLALPWILVGAFELGGSSQPAPGAPGLVDLATTGGLNFAAFSFFASVGFLLVVAVGAVLRGHRGQRGAMGLAAVPARRTGAPRPAAPAEARRGAGLTRRSQ